MDPNFSNSPGLALPTPNPEHSAINNGIQRHDERQEINQGNMQAAASGAVQLDSAMPQSSVSPQAIPAMPSAQGQSAAMAGASDDDVDAIDKEWIGKAKAIVEKTRNDPYVESNELGRVKADYLKTRYNKHIKVVE